MANNSLGELRRSSVVMTFAPGAVVDFRAGSAPVSAVVAGLEEWDHSFAPAGLANPQQITEPRLQQKLKVGGFRLPPVVPESFGRDEQEDNRSLVAVRFPRWLQCPECDEIAPARRWAQEPGRAYRYCARCTSRKPAGRKVAAIPVRFVLACSSGHLDEFPWHFWVQHKADCKHDKSEGKLFLRAMRPGLAGLILSCPKCEASRSMDGVFSFKEFHCSGRRPWLSESLDPHGCGSAQGARKTEVRAVQRGASNLYFPVIESALDIPPWADQLQHTVGMYWSSIMAVESAPERRQFISILGRGALADALRQLSMTPDQLADTIEARISGLHSTAGEDLRLDEYRKLSSGVDTERAEGLEFEIRNEGVPLQLKDVVSGLVRVTRLREVRVLRGFTRIYPGGGEEDATMAPISSRKLDWLPAIEVRGEGIFIKLRESALQTWESSRLVVSRVMRLSEAAERDWRVRNPDLPLPFAISPRFVLIHTLAHALIRQLTLECGYSTASLRERLYVSEGDNGMCGLLIYTSTPDSDGTLGGLERQGLGKRFETVFINAIRSQEWCSSDPLCIEEGMGGLDSLSLAACHACCLAPETSCEHYNRYLDRALLVGTPGSSETGLFSSLLTGDDHGSSVAATSSA